MRVMIPASVDVKYLVDKLNLSPTRKENIKNKIYYLLSLIVTTNDTYCLYEDQKGYRRISSVLMKKIMDREDYYLIIQLLTDPTDPIIGSNKSWHNGKEDGSGYCQGYRLCQKYNTGEVIWRTIPAKFSRRIENHHKNDPEANFDDSKYQFLYEQLDNNKLRFDPSVNEYIRSFGQELLSRANGNEFQTELVYNLVGSWLFYVKKIENDDIWRQVSPANWRLNSSVTHLKRTLRPFLLFNGERLAEADITASQPSFLAAVMKDEFITGTDGFFNLQSISPIIFQKLIDSGYISTSTWNSSFSYGHVNYSGSTIHTEFDPDLGSSAGSNQNKYSFMWGEFFNENELESIKSYQFAPFQDDFYMHLVNTGSLSPRQKTQSATVLRERMKDNMKYVLFDANPKHRSNGTYMKLFNELYPGVDKWIYTLLSEVKSTEFSYLLQRAESYFVLDVVSQEFHKRYPTAPIISIHDAICTYPDYLPGLIEIIQKRAIDIIGTSIGLKEKLWLPEPIPKSEDINEQWKDIKTVNSLRKYQEKAHSVFSTNINRGRQFLG